MTRATFPVVVHTLLIRDEQLFLLRRSNTGFMDGYYSLPGGHQHAGESVSAAAIRECLEETGIQITGLSPVCAMPYQSGRHQGLNFVFEADAWTGEPAVNEPALFDECCWCPLGDLPKPYPPWMPEVFELRGRGDWFTEFHWD